VLADSSTLEAHDVSNFNSAKIDDTSRGNAHRLDFSDFSVFCDRKAQDPPQN
jgi:hypothetical protein